MAGARLALKVSTPPRQKTRATTVDKESDTTMTRNMTRRIPAWSVYFLGIALAEGTGMIAALATGDAMTTYGTQMAVPVFAPPAALFPIAWTVLYALMGIGAARVWLTEPSRARTRALMWFALQLAMNFAWTFIFFSFSAYGLAFVWVLGLLAAVVMMALAFKKVDTPAALAQIPYIAWLTFAAVLNAAVWYLN